MRGICDDILIKELEGKMNKNSNIVSYRNRKDTDIKINPKCAYREILLDSASTGHANMGLESKQKKKKQRKQK